MRVTVPTTFKPYFSVVVPLLNPLFWHCSGKYIAIHQLCKQKNHQGIHLFVCQYKHCSEEQQRKKKEQDKTRKRVSFLSLKRAVWDKLNMTPMTNRWLGSLQTMSGKSKVLLTKQNVLLHLRMVVEETLEGGIKRTPTSDTSCHLCYSSVHTCTSESSQRDRVRDFTFPMSGMFRWIPEQPKQMKTPNEHEPHSGPESEMLRRVLGYSR